MLGPEAERAGEFGLPVAHRLARPRGDEIEADAREGRLRDVERGEASGEIVRAAEEPERVIVQGLQAEADAVDARRAEARKARGFDRGGIGFKRDLDLGVGGPQVVRALGHGGDRGGVHQRGGAAAEEDAGQPVTGRARGLPGEFGQQRVPVRALVPGGADVAVEITVGTFANAERPMDVERERVRARPRPAWRRRRRGG